MLIHIIHRSYAHNPPVADFMQNKRMNGYNYSCGSLSVSSNLGGIYMRSRRSLFAALLSSLLLVFLFLTSFFALAVPSFAAPDCQEAANLLFEATKSETPLPSLDVPVEFRNAENAYRVQSFFVQKLLAQNGDAIAGFKAGLTAEPQMRRFNATSPAGAPLFKGGLIEVLDSSKPIRLKPFKGMMLETELAFKTAQPITEALKDESALKALIATVHPAVEVPQLFFADMGKVDFFEIVASAIGSKIFLAGGSFSLAEVDPDTVKVRLTLNGDVVNEGAATDALDGQWKALLWLVNSMLERGYKIEAGQYLLTGALGKMIPAKSGLYVADFGFTTLEFEVEK